MSREAVETEILATMQKLFQPPRAEMSDGDIAAALAQYADSLEHFDANILREAWRQTREHHIRSNWPTIAAIHKLATLAHRRLQTVSKAPATTPRSLAEQRLEDDRMFLAFCEHRGLDPSVMRRPNLWWLLPKAEWRDDWHESQIPKMYRPSSQASQPDQQTQDNAPL